MRGFKGSALFKSFAKEDWINAGHVSRSGILSLFCYAHKCTRIPFDCYSLRDFD